MKTKFIIVFVLLSLCINLYATQDNNDLNNYKTEHFSFEKGIAHETVYDIYKDSKGFLWFGTMYGLVHYMGTNTKIYRHDPSNKNSLSNDDVTKIFEDSKGKFWIATFGGGFNKLDLSNNKVTRYTPSSLNLFEEWNGISWDIVEDKNGQIFIASDDAGVFKLDPATNKYAVYKNAEDNTELTGEKKFFVDSNGDVYLILSTRKLYKYQSDTETFAAYNFQNLDTKDITSIEQGADNDLYIAVNNKILHYNITDQTHRNLSDEFPDLQNLYTVNELFLDSKNNLWIGSFGRLFVIDSTREKLVQFSAMADIDKRIPGGPVIEIVEDNTGIVWTGSYIGGITKISNKKELFSSVEFEQEFSNTNSIPRVTSVFPLSNEELLVGTNVGLYSYNLSQQKFKDRLKNVVVYSIKQDKSNELWLGTNRGIFLLDKNYTVIKKITSSKNDTNSLASNQVTCLVFDKDNMLWAGTSNGLNKVDIANDKVIRYVDDNSEFSGKAVLSVYVDKRGYVWAGTYDGINRFNPATNKFKLFRHDFDDTNTISNNYVFSYCEDINGSFWIGTGNGINKFNYDSNTFETISVSDGLGNGVIFGINEFENNLFLSTAKGISVYNYKDGSIYSYNTIHGLHSNMFNSRSYAKLPNNKIVFGGLGGFTIVNTSEFSNNPIDAKVYITSITSAEVKIIENPVYSQTNEISLPYNASYIRFNFSSLDFSLPEGISYEFMLEGFDTTWINSNNESFATYSKIPSGEYKFAVRTNGSNSSLASINVIVTPPFWETWWFYFSLIFIFVLSAFIIYRNKLRIALKRAAEIEQIRNEEERKLRKKASEDFHDELGHRITKISLYSELLKRTISDQESGSLNYLHKISDISTNLATGVKDFIWTLDPGKDTLYDVAIRLKDFGDDLFDKSGISFRTSGISQDYTNIELQMDWRRHTILIFKEAMNNILKYSDAKNVLLTFTVDNNEIDISLNDDGKGFDTEKIKSGRGLKNIRMRAASVQGKVDIKSSHGEGTSISFHSSLK